MMPDDSGRTTLPQADGGVIRYFKAAVAILLAVYWGVAVATALAQRPWCDEAWNASPALNLITNGVMGTPALETVGTTHQGIDRYTYWIMPLHPLSQAGWYKAFGFGVLSLRAYSMLWGVIGLFAWLTMMRRLTSDRLATLVAFGLLATDFIFIQRSAEGRMDIMSASLGFAALAAYLVLRERRLTAAIFVSHALVTASCLTHPNGIMPGAALVFLTIFFDWRRLRPMHLAVAAAPYVVGVLGWGWYLAQAPEFARIQLEGNSGGRFLGLRAPLTALRLELVDRYLRVVGGWAPDLSTLHHLKIIVLAAYAAGVAGVLASRDLRARPGVRALLGMTAIYFVIMTWWDGVKMPLYLIHIAPFYIALLAIWATHLWRRPSLRPLVAGGMAAVVAVQLGGTAYVVKRDTYGNAYRPAIAWLKANGGGDVHVMGSSELGFDLGFFENLTDDVRLGHDSGKKPDLIVVEDRYIHWFESFQRKEPGVYAFIQKRLGEEYRPVYEHDEYTIYAPR